MDCVFAGWKVVHYQTISNCFCLPLCDMSIWVGYNPALQIINYASNRSVPNYIFYETSLVEHSTLIKNNQESRVVGVGGGERCCQGGHGKAKDDNYEEMDDHQEMDDQQETGKKGYEKQEDEKQEQRQEQKWQEKGTEGGHR